MSGGDCYNNYPQKLSDIYSPCLYISFTVRKVLTIEIHLHANIYIRSYVFQNVDLH